MAVVHVIYHHFPHYRAPILRELKNKSIHEFHFWGSLEDIEGIKSFKGDKLVFINKLQLRICRNIWNLSGFWRAVFDRRADAIIVHNLPYMPASWFIPVVARLLGKKVLFWGHGWLRTEPFIKRIVRLMYYFLANGLLTYNERSIDIGVRSGYPRERIRVIYNSLDFEYSSILYANIRKTSEDSKEKMCANYFLNPERPLIICVARLTRACNFEILLEAGGVLSDLGININILLVGDGPERIKLEEISMNERNSIYFYGSCYDEVEICRMTYWADLTVSPGKVGLSAIQSLTYGTPVISHSDLDHQMPEVEAVIEGYTGALFKRGDASDLARVIQNWLINHPNRDEVRSACRNIVALKWNPSNQRDCIDAAINSLLGV